MKFLILWLALLVPLQADQKVYRIMPVGDSITEGGSSFSNWRYPLWEKLYTGGYLIKYVGSRQTPSPIGELLHEGYSGKNSGFLASTVPANFKKHPADIVLLHAGHNHSSEQKPVPQILKDTESLIQDFRRVNPKVTVLLAQPIPSGKLPKYAYLPELNQQLVLLAKRLDKPASRIVIVPQADGFNPVIDTVADLVHPNASGAAKMTQRWFDALVSVMEKPPIVYQPEILPYKSTSKGDLTLHVFRPAAATAVPRPAIVFFFGGEWQRGTPLQFYPECHELASKGMVAISADYRTAFSHGTTAFEAVADGKSAVRWIRAHAKELGIDPYKITAAGASAGGQVAAAAGIITGLDDASEDLSISSRPDALALWYPLIDNGPQGYGDAVVKSRYQEVSPLHNVSVKSPPTLFFLGTKDPLVPVATAREFESRMKKAGVRCEVKLIEGGAHPLYGFQTGASPLRENMLKDFEAFLLSMH